MNSQEQPSPDQQKEPEGGSVLELKDRVYLVPVRRRLPCVLYNVEEEY